MRKTLFYASFVLPLLVAMVGAAHIVAGDFKKRYIVAEVIALFASAYLGRLHEAGSTLAYIK